MASNTRVPPGTAAKSYTLAPGANPFPFVVLLAVPPAEPTPEAFASLIATRGAVCASLTHEAGVSWPDPQGWAILRTVLGRGGSVRLAFARLSDARACERRARRAAR